MQDTVIDRVVPHQMRRANDIIRTLMQFFGRPGRAGCRDAAAGVFGNDSWDDLQQACIDQHPSAPSDEGCPDLGRRRRAQARLLYSSTGGVDPSSVFDSPMRPKGPPDPVESVLHTEVRMKQAGKRYEQLFAQVLVAELQPTAYQPVRGSGAELLADASRGTVAALPLYLARWWNVNLKH